MTRAEAITQWVRDYGTPKRRRLWARQWERSGLTAAMRDIAENGGIDPCDPPPERWDPV